MTDYILWIYPLAVLLVAAAITVAGWLRARSRYQHVPLVQRVRDLEQYQATIGGAFDYIVVDATLTEDEITEMDSEPRKTGRHERPPANSSHVRNANKTDTWSDRI